MNNMFFKLIFIFSAFTFMTQCENNTNTTKEEDLQKLEQLFNQIKQISESETCSNATEWKIAAYGSKACGGSQGYIAYSIKIDESNFLKLVENYTNEEAKFNQKWGVVSDCSLVVAPKSVI